MSQLQALVTEIQQEGENSKKILERIPEDKFDWKPHEKSMRLKSLATHIAQLAGWPGLVVTTEELDFQKGGLNTPEINSTEDLIRYLEAGVQASIEALQNTTVEALNENWILRSGDQVIFEMPKIAVIRGMSMNHLIHHRGQLSVYLRLLDIPVRGMYGPSADEK